MSASGTTVAIHDLRRFIMEVKDLLPHRTEVCLLIKKAFDTEFCGRIIKRYRTKFKAAKTHYPTSYRNNQRFVADDPALAESLFVEIKRILPKHLVGCGVSDVEKGEWKLLRLNERIRICRYLPGQYFSKHLDGVHYHSESIQSKLTFMIYLNSSSEFRGGRTLFFASKLDERIIGSYEPEEGDLIVFDHNLWHSGERLSSGEKYILRSDILYERISPALSNVCGNFREGHLGYIWNVVKGANFYFTAGRDKKIKVWNGKGEKLQELIGHKNSILCLLWTDWNNLVSCSRDETIRIWQIKSGRYVSVGEGRFHQGTVLSLCSLGKTEFCSCGSDGKIIVYSDKGTPKLVIEAHDEWVWQVKAITDNIVASISEDGCVKLWQLKPFCLLASLELGNPLTALAHDQKGHILYLGDVKGNVWQVQYTLPKVNLKLLSQHVCHADKILFIKQHGGFLATGSEDNSFALWNKANMSKVFEHPHRNFVQDAHIESGVAITVSYDGQIRRFAIPLSE